MDLQELGERSEIANQTNTEPTASEVEKRMLKKQYLRERYLANREKYIRAAVERKRANPERVRELANARNAANRDEVRRKQREYYAKTKEAYRARANAYRHSNPDKAKQWRDNWKKNNPEAYKLSAAKYRTKWKEKIAAWHKLNYVENNDKIRAYQREYEKARFASDPAYAILKNMRRRVARVFRITSTRKAFSTLRLLGCSAADFKSHLEKQFTPEMNWKNYGDYWEVDHISPVTAFDLTIPHQQRLAFHYSNCRPLAKSANQSKGDRVMQIDELIDL